MKEKKDNVWSAIENIIYNMLSLLFRIRKKQLSQETFQAFLQFIKFGIVGLTNTIVGYVLNVGTLFMLKKYSVSWDYIAGNLVGFFLSVLWSFYWNNKYVFTVKDGKRRNIWKALLKTYVSYGFTGVVLTNMLSYVWVSVLGMSKYIAPLVNLVVSVPINFIINKMWAFREQDSDARI